jgi:hypothetical protein
LLGLQHLHDGGVAFGALGAAAILLSALGLLYALRLPSPATAGEPQECRDAFKARSVAAILASDPNNCGAVAFSRTGDAALGEFDDAVIIARLGEVDDTLTQ